MENFKGDISIYSIDYKGTLAFVDILSYAPREKKAVFINDQMVTSSLGKTERRVSYHTLSRKLEKLKKKGYEIQEIDGAKERVSKDTILSALNLEYSKEKLCELSHMRAEIYPYFSIDIIKKVFRRYIHGELEDFYLDYWAKLYIACLYESYNIDKEIKKTLFIDEVCLSLEELASLLSKDMTSKEKIDLVHKVYQQIKRANENYLNQLEKDNHSKK